jgi:hypothetical protein
MDPLNDVEHFGVKVSRRAPDDLSVATCHRCKRLKSELAVSTKSYDAMLVIYSVKKYDAVCGFISGIVFKRIK